MGESNKKVSPGDTFFKNIFKNMDAEFNKIMNSFDMDAEFNRLLNNYNNAYFGGAEGAVSFTQLTLRRLRVITCSANESCSLSWK